MGRRAAAPRIRARSILQGIVASMTKLGTNARGGGFALTFAVLALWCCGWWSPGARAQDDATSLERRVKAAYIFKFAGYVEWPEGAFSQPDTPVTIAVFGDAEMAAELVQSTAGRAVDRPPVRIKRKPDPQTTPGPPMPFVRRAQNGALMPVLKMLRENWLQGARYSVRKKLMWVVMTTTLVALLIASGAMVVYELRTYHEARLNDLFSQADLIGRSSAAALVFDDPKTANANLA